MGGHTPPTQPRWWWSVSTPPGVLGGHWGGLGRVGLAHRAPRGLNPWAFCHLSSGAPLRWLVCWRCRRRSSSSSSSRWRWRRPSSAVSSAAAARSNVSCHRCPLHDAPLRLRWAVLCRWREEAAHPVGPTPVILARFSCSIPPRAPKSLSRTELRTGFRTPGSGPHSQLRPELRADGTRFPPESATIYSQLSALSNTGVKQHRPQIGPLVASNTHPKVRPCYATPPLAAQRVRFGTTTLEVTGSNPI